MTIEQAIEKLELMRQRVDEETYRALILAIKALEQEPRKDEVILTKEEYGELVSSEFDNGYARGYREALEEEPCVEPLERLAELASKTAKILERLSEQEPIEVEATKLQMAYNQGFEDCRKAVIDELKKWDWQELYLPIHFKENIIDVIPSVNPQETKTGHWVRFDNGKYHWYLCSCCDAMAGSDEKKMAYKYCPNCGAKMESEV